MTYKNFIQEVLQELRRHLPEGTEADVRRILKNNNLCLDGLTITEHSLNISPALYLNYYYEQYQNGTSLTEIVQRILERYSRHRLENNIDLSFFTDFSQVKPHIIYKLIHKERNAVLLQDVPHIPYLDLAIVFCISLSVPDASHLATILIHNCHLPYWDATADLLMQHAAHNTPRLFPWQLQDIQNVIKDILPEDLPDEIRDTKSSMPMYLLTNQSKIHGACCMLYDNVLSDCSRRFESDLIILPSSIHELLLVPTDTDRYFDEFTQIVRDVNAAAVSREEILSDHPYYYSRKTNSITF